MVRNERLDLHKPSAVLFQNCIATHECNGIDIIIALILNDINPLGKKRMDLVLELKVFTHTHTHKQHTESCFRPDFSTSTAHVISHIAVVKFVVTAAQIQLSQYKLTLGWSLCHFQVL